MRLFCNAYWFVFGTAGIATTELRISTYIYSWNPQPNCEYFTFRHINPCSLDRYQGHINLDGQTYSQIGGLKGQYSHVEKTGRPTRGLPEVQGVVRRKTHRTGRGEFRGLGREGGETCHSTRHQTFSPCSKGKGGFVPHLFLTRHS